jgi:hypothetical protein
MRRQQILSAQIANDLVTWAPVVPDRFDQANVLVNMTVGALDFGGAKINGVLLFRDRLINTISHMDVKHFLLLPPDICAPMTFA